MTHPYPKLPHYEIIAQIGEGGMGAVFKATHLPSQTIVAIKALKGDIATPEMIARFRQEGQALRDLNHPHIVKMIEALEADNHHYLVMEYVEGGSLRQLLDQTPQLPIERVVNIALDLADALTRAHRLKIIHRDIKPPNVLLTADGTPRLTDFGIARIGTVSNLTAPHSTLGTIPYLSPEGLRGEPLDERADIWAFGVMLFEMVAGQNPFVKPTDSTFGAMRAILETPLPDLNSFRDDVPPVLVNLIAHMLEKDLMAWVQSVRIVGAELEGILHERSVKLPSSKPLIADRFAPLSDTTEVIPAEEHTPLMPPAPSEEKTTVITQIPTATARPPRWLWWGSGAAILLIVGLIGL